MSNYYWDLVDKYNTNASNSVKNFSPMNIPRGGKRNSIGTGAGPDNVIQPSNPAMLDFSSGTPSVIHEGEQVSNASNGKSVTPHRDVRRGMIDLNTPEKQRIVSSMEQGTMPGFRGGGFMPGYQDGGLIPNQQQPQQTGLPQQSFQTPFSQAIAQAPAQVQPTAVPTQTQAMGLQVPQQPQQQQVQPQQQQQPQQQIAGTGVAPTAQQPQGQQQQAPGKPVKPGQEALTQESMESVMRGDTPKFDTVDDFKKHWDKSLLELQKIAGGNSELFEQLKNVKMGQLGAEQAAGTAAAEQRALQQGLSPETSRLIGQQRDRSQAMERGNLRNQLTQLESQAAIDATNQSVQQGLMRTQFEFQEKQNLANNLIEQGGFENLDRAEEVLTELYGTPIDLQNLRNKQTLRSVADLVALGGGIEETMQLAQQQGLAQNLGIDENELRTMVNSMVVNSNPISQAEVMYKDLVSNGTITQEQANQAMEVMKWTMLNPQGVEISNSFAVTDANGNQVGNFKTEEEADSFIANNADKGYNKKFEKNGWIGLKGSYEEYLGSKVEGDVFEQNGKLFRLVNGQKVDARMTPTVPFSSTNNSLYKYYINSGRQEQANDILNLQVDHLRSLEDEDGDIDLPAGITEDHPAYKIWAKGNTSLNQGQKIQPTKVKKKKTTSSGETQTGEISGGETSGDTSNVEIPYE